MCINEDNSKEEIPILVKDEGIMKRYKNQQNGKEYTVLGELIPSGVNEKVKKFKGIISWSNNVSLIKQVGLLKKICPVVGAISNSELLKIAKEKPEWQFGIFLPEEAEELISKGEENKLNISMIELK